MNKIIKQKHPSVEAPEEGVPAHQDQEDQDLAKGHVGGADHGPNEAWREEDLPITTQQKLVVEILSPTRKAVLMFHFSAF